MCCPTLLKKNGFSRYGLISLKTANLIPLCLSHTKNWISPTWPNTNNNMSITLDPSGILLAGKHSPSKSLRIFSIKWKQRVHLNNNYCFVFFNNVHRKESIIVFKVDWHCWKSILSQQWIGNTTAWTKDTRIWYYTVNPLSMSHHSRDMIFDSQLDDHCNKLHFAAFSSMFFCFLYIMWILITNGFADV